MNFLHSTVQVGPGQSIIVSLDQAANVQVMDDVNLRRYKLGQRFEYFGGFARRSPAVMKPPHPGRWNVAVDLGGGRGAVRVGIRVQ